MKRISSMMSRKSSKSTLNETQDTIPVLLLGPRTSGKTSFLYKSYFKYATDNVRSFICVCCCHVLKYHLLIYSQIHILMFYLHLTIMLKLYPINRTFINYGILQASFIHVCLYIINMHAQKLALV